MHPNPPAIWVLGHPSVVSFCGQDILAAVSNVPWGGPRSRIVRERPSWALKINSHNKSIYTNLYCFDRPPEPPFEGPANQPVESLDDGNDTGEQGLFLRLILRHPVLPRLLQSQQPHALLFCMRKRSLLLLKPMMGKKSTLLRASWLHNVQTSNGLGETGLRRESLERHTYLLRRVNGGRFRGMS